MSVSTVMLLPVAAQTHLMVVSICLFVPSCLSLYFCVSKICASRGDFSSTTLSRQKPDTLLSTELVIFFLSSSSSGLLIIEYLSNVSVFIIDSASSVLPVPCLAASKI